MRARLPVKKRRSPPPHTRFALRKKNTWRPEQKEGRDKSERDFIFHFTLYIFPAVRSFLPFSFGRVPFFSRIQKKLRRDRKNKAHESVSTHTEVVESRCQRWVLLFARTKLRPGRLERGDRRTRVDRRDRSSSRGEDRNRRRRRRRRRRLSAVEEGRTKEEELLRRRRR